MITAQRPFVDLLRELRGGATVLDLADHLEQLTAAVVSTGKPGKLTLTLTLTPAGVQSEALVMLDDIALTLPSPANAATVFFATDDFQLTREDSREVDESSSEDLSFEFDEPEPEPLDAQPEPQPLAN